MAKEGRRIIIFVTVLIVAIIGVAVILRGDGTTGSFAIKSATGNPSCLVSMERPCYSLGREVIESSLNPELGERLYNTCFETNRKKLDYPEQEDGNVYGSIIEATKYCGKNQLEVTNVCIILGSGSGPASTPVSNVARQWVLKYTGRCTTLTEGWGAAS